MLVDQHKTELFGRTDNYHLSARLQV